MKLDLCVYFYVYEYINIYRYILLPWWLSNKESACQCRRCRFNPWVRKIPWRREWLPPPVFLPGKSHGQRSLACYNLWGCKRVGHDLTTKQHNDRYIYCKPQIKRILFLFFEIRWKKLWTMACHQDPCWSNTVQARYSWKPLVETWKWN